MPTRPRIQAATTNSATDDHRTRLVALRDRLTTELDGTPSAAAVAAIARQLQSVLSELAQMTDPGEPAGPLAEITARRNARRAAIAADFPGIVDES